MEKKLEEILVSVPVITYNSSKYVLETLESIKAQTYQNIELIVSDDCSTDNTVEICRKWIEENKERFVCTEIITSDINTGVSANGNRGRNACRGEWIKGIAGDDLLMPNCVEEYINYVKENNEAIAIFSKVIFFGENINVDSYENFFDYSFFDLNNQEEKKWLYTKALIPIPAPTLFYNRNKFEKYDIYNDERIPLLEDQPKWAKLIEKDIKFHFINKQLIKYRVSESSLSTCRVFSKASVRSYALYWLLYKFPTNIKYIGRRKAYQDYICYKAVVSNCLIWKIGRFIIHLLYYPYEKFIKK